VFGLKMFCLEVTLFRALLEQTPRQNCTYYFLLCKKCAILFTSLNRSFPPTSPKLVKPLSTPKTQAKAKPFGVLEN